MCSVELRFCASFPIQQAEILRIRSDHSKLLQHKRKRGSKSMLAKMSRVWSILLRVAFQLLVIFTRVESLKANSACFISLHCQVDEDFAMHADQNESDAQ